MTQPMGQADTSGDYAPTFRPLDSPPSSSSHTTSSSSRPSTASYGSSSSSRTNAPTSQPAVGEHSKSSKGPSLHPSHKLRLGRRKEKGRKDVNDRNDEDWTLEDGSGGRGSMDMASEEILADLEASQLTERAYGEGRRAEKESKGMKLAKKTSQLFSRKDKDRPPLTHDDSQSTLSIPTSSRHTSFSSAASGESSRTNGYSNPSSSSITQQPSSHPSRRPNALSGSANTRHTRRISQDSQISWQGIKRTVRSGSNSTDSATESHLPLPQRRPSNLSASVPALSRSSMPPPTANQAMPASVSTRVSTWFTNFMSSSTTPETVTASAAPGTGDPSSSARKTTSAAATFLNAARQRAVDGVRHLLDTEAQPDKSTETIWLMGVPHPGYRPGTPDRSPSTQRADLPNVSEERRGSDSSGRPSPPSKADSQRSDTLRPAAWAKRKDSGPMSPPSRGLGQLISGSTLSLVSGSPSKQDGGSAIVDSPGRGRKATGKEKEVLRWPDAFYEDFQTRIWCTYRTQYAPILSLPNNLLLPSSEAYHGAFAHPTQASSKRDPEQPILASKPSSWGWSRAPEERGLTSDAGWGCMLRTGQSLLANALIHLHLGRGWRVPSPKPNLDSGDPSSMQDATDYAEYVRILSYFLDDPSPLCPFSVHRMALIGKVLGKEVGEWFGPSTAAGALKTLANSFPPCRLAVATAADGTIYKSDVYAASSLRSAGWEQDDLPNPAERRSGIWGNKAVLILVGLRLGLEGVNPIYHDAIKALFTFPQSVGIAGGRPNTSYYFVASQGNSLFYLDPHFTRPAVPLEVPPEEVKPAHHREEATTGPDEPGDGRIEASTPSPNLPAVAGLDLVDVDDLSDNSDHSLSPSKTRPKTKTTRHIKRLSGVSSGSTPLSSTAPKFRIPSTPSTPLASSGMRANRPPDVFDEVISDNAPHEGRAETPPRSSREVDIQTRWYLDAYTDTQLRTFHSDRVRKMPLSGLDPSMLLGFLVKDEADFRDFCERVSRLPQKIFSVENEPPSWEDDDAAGLESVSEPEISDEEEDSREAVPTFDDAELIADKEVLNSIASDRVGLSIDSPEVINGEAGPSSRFGDHGVVDRATTLNSIITTVEQPNADMPQNAIPRTPKLADESSGAAINAPVDADSNGAGTTKSAHAVRPAPGVLRGVERQRTDSWIKPDRSEVDDM